MPTDVAGDTNPQKSNHRRVSFRQYGRPRMRSTIHGRVGGAGVIYRARRPCLRSLRASRELLEKTRRGDQHIEDCPSHASRRGVHDVALEDTACARTLTRSRRVASQGILLCIHEIVYTTQEGTRKTCICLPDVRHELNSSHDALASTHARAVYSCQRPTGGIL